MAVKKEKILATTNQKATPKKRKSPAKKKVKITQNDVVYGLYIDDKLQYVGSSSNFENRKKSHIESLQKNKHSNKSLTKAYKESKNKKIEFKILLEMPESNSLIKFFSEMLFISYVGTINRCVIQVRSVRLQLAKCNPILAKKLLECIFEFYGDKCKHINLDEL